MSNATMFMACWGEPNEGYCASSGRLFDDLDQALVYIKKQKSESCFEWIIFELEATSPGVWEPNGYCYGPQEA